MFWTITNGRYQFIDKHAFNNFQNNVLTLNTIVLVANIVVEGVVIKKKAQSNFPRLEVFCPNGKVIIYRPL
jgi:hypothetical protein